MQSEIIVYRTDEIPVKIWQEICEGYKICFDIKRTPEQLKNNFTKSITGYSLHALKFSESGKVIAHNYYQPRPYIINGENKICALGGGTYVLPEYRKDAFIFYDMIHALNKEAKKLGWIARLGVPNENAYQYALKILKDKQIGDLSYYILPIKISKILKTDKPFLDTLSSIYCKTLVKVNNLISYIWNCKEVTKLVHLDLSDKFLNIRFDQDGYVNLRKGSIRGIYKVYDEGGIRTAYITYFGDNFRRTNKSLCFVVKEILKKEEVDAILYVGTMNFAQSLLTKVPQKYVPQKLSLFVSIIDNKDLELKKIFSSMKNIDFGLINFDVR